MDIQQILHNAVQAQRNEEMKTSEQLTLGELILKLEVIGDKDKPVIFNEQYHPHTIDSWRGSYCELALGYAQTGKPFPVHLWLQKLRETIGATFTGYKGGEFLMGKTTPIWVANYGESNGFLPDGEQAVIGVSETEQAVMIETKPMEL